MTRWLLAAVVVLLAAGAAEAACTKGTNCMCDCVSGPDRGDGFKNATCATAGTYVGTSASNPQGAATTLWCEDWDDAGYYLPTDVSNWVARIVDSHPWNRGNGSRFFLNYGNGGSSGLWSQGNPTPPLKIPGTQKCDVPGFANCTGNMEWCSTGQGGAFGRHCWDEDRDPNSVPLADVVTNIADVRDEIGTLNLSGGTDNGGTVFGNYAFAYRLPAANSSNILGNKNFPRSLHVGLTVAYAYSSNMVANGAGNSPWNQAWKHEEWYDSSDPGAFYEFSMYGGQQNMANARPASVPYTGFLFGVSNAACTAGLAAATITKGHYECDGSGNVLWRAEATEYTQAVDFPNGTWHCIQAELIWSGGTFTHRNWIDGRPVMSMSGYPISALHVQNGYTSVFLNPYSNYNDHTLNPVGPFTLVTMYRYMDNMYVRNGTPVACSQIGLTGGAGPTPPAAPTGLRFGVVVLLSVTAAWLAAARLSVV